MAATEYSPVELVNRLQHWSPEKVRQVNLLCRRGIYGQTTINGQTANWRLGICSEQIYQPIVLHHDTSTAEFQFSTDNWAKPVDGRHWQDFPSRQWPLSFLLAHEQWLQHLQLLFGIPWQLDSLSHSTPNAQEQTLDVPEQLLANHLVWQWRVECQGQLSVGLLKFDDRALESLSAQPFWHETALAVDPALLEAPIHLQIRLPVLSMPIAELQQFSAGDILIGSPAKNLQPCVVRHMKTNVAIWSGIMDIKNRSFNISQGWLKQPKPRKEPMSDTSSSAKKQPHIDDIPVEIEFCLGEVTMPLAAFNDLQPGHTFTLNSAAQGDNVTILANGHEIGKGSLIIVGDNLGVLLTDVGSDGHR